VFPPNVPALALEVGGGGKNPKSWDPDLRGPMWTAPRVPKKINFSGDASIVREMCDSVSTVRL